VSGGPRRVIGGVVEAIRLTVVVFHIPQFRNGDAALIAVVVLVLIVVGAGFPAIATMLLVLVAPVMALLGVTFDALITTLLPRLALNLGLAATFLAVGLEDAIVVIGMLGVVLGGHPVTHRKSVTGKGLIFVVDLLSRAADLPVRTGALKR
jgi:hypothetical protein